jgi:hypothetical protein
LDPTNAAYHSINLVAGAKGIDPRSDLFHYPGHIKSKHRRERLFGVGSLPGTNLGVQRIHATSVDPQQNLAWRRSGAGKIDFPKGSCRMFNDVGTHRFSVLNDFK